MKKISKILSAVFSPLIVPCYGIAMSLCVTPLFVIPFKYNPQYEMFRLPETKCSAT